MSHTASAVPTCAHCGSPSPHQGQCPRIKAIEYHENGTVKRVEYFTATQLLGLSSVPDLSGLPFLTSGSQGENP